MTTRPALFARLEAKPGKEIALASFLQGALDLARAEDGTTTWFALRFDDETFAIFDTFEHEEDRQAHLDGDVARALFQKADNLLSAEPRIEKVELLAAKLP